MHCFLETREPIGRSHALTIMKNQSWQSYLDNHGSTEIEPPPTNLGLCQDGRAFPASLHWKSSVSKY